MYVLTGPSAGHARDRRGPDRRNRSGVPHAARHERPDRRQLGVRPTPKACARSSRSKSLTLPRDAIRCWRPGSARGIYSDPVFPCRRQRSRTRPECAFRFHTRCPRAHYGRSGAGRTRGAWSENRPPTSPGESDHSRFDDLDAFTVLVRSPQRPVRFEACGGYPGPEAEARLRAYHDQGPVAGTATVRPCRRLHYWSDVPLPRRRPMP